MVSWGEDGRSRGAVPVAPGQRLPLRERRGTLARRASIRRRAAIMVAPGRRVVPHYPGWAVISPSGDILSLHGDRRLALAAAEREQPE